jgi:hypothetical protein
LTGTSVDQGEASLPFNKGRGVGSADRIIWVIRNEHANAAHIASPLGTRR